MYIQQIIYAPCKNCQNKKHLLGKTLHRQFDITSSTQLYEFGDLVYMKHFAMILWSLIDSLRVQNESSMKFRKSRIFYSAFKDGIFKYSSLKSSMILGNQVQSIALLLSRFYATQTTKRQDGKYYVSFNWIA